MLLIAASHLRFLQPQESSRRIQELEHFSKVIPSFSKQLSDPITTKNATVYIACSLLILQHAWASLDTADQDGNNWSKWGFSSLPALYLGMRELGLRACSVCDPYVTGVITDRPIHRIMNYLEYSSVPSELEEFFIRCCECPSWLHTDDSTITVCMSAARSLIPLLSTLKLDRLTLDASGLMPDTLRCLFIWPLLTPDGFGQLLEKNDEVSLVIVLYYCAAVLGLVSEKSWWMQERAAYASRSILSRLGDRCEECIGWAREICEGNYF